jgi:SAM-dependent methyltransferase
MAVPLTEYLTPDGRYEGFDIVPHGVAWCQKHISARFSNFGFQLADIQNKEYNPTGRVPAAEFRFPYSAGSFDFVFLTSVFTHMLPREVDNYLSEVYRVLRPDGQCLITWFLLNPESETLVLEGKAAIVFPHQVYGCRVANPTVPEEAVAYHEPDVLEAYRRHGLELHRPIHYGSWCGRSDYVSFQDICIARKLAN